MTLIDTLHRHGVFPRRLKVLARWLSELLPPDAQVLDIGCGDGSLDALIQQCRPDVTITGIDVMVRPHTAIPVTAFDGRTIPFADKTFDAAMMVDVLHHTENPAILLAEASRISRQGVVIKDHLRDGLLANQTLRFMDWVGNAHHGVVLPYNYWSERQWRSAFTDLGLTTEGWRTELGLYPWPASLLFDRSLHFVTRLTSRL